jgi:16S rRNA (cytidine1402-2'-O)-methyltransferase
MGTLYLVGTPIGNLEDVTLRALRVLREVSLIAAENIRHAQRLLSRYDISVPCMSYHEHSKLARLDDVLTALANGDVALISDSGTPVLSAPGFELVNACISAGFDVVPVPGPNAAITALIASGLSPDQFIHLGMLPRRGAERRALLQALVELPQTLVCFEAPHRITDSLKDMLVILGDRRIAMARDLTRAHEQFRRERISQALDHFTRHRPHGEFTLVVEGRVWRSNAGRKAALAADEASDEPLTDTPPADAALPSEAEVAARLRALRDQGKSGSAAARQVARELGINKSLVYQVWIGLNPDQMTR